MPTVSSLATPTPTLATATAVGGVPTTSTAATANPATTAQATAGSAAANTEGVALSDLVQVVASTLLVVLQVISKDSSALSSATATTTSPLSNASPGTAATPVAATAAASPTSDVSAALDKLIIGGTTQQKADLKQNLVAISQDPDGAKLVAESIRKGVTFNVGDPATAGGANDVQSVATCPTCAAAAAQTANDNGDGTSGNVVINGVTVTKNDGHSDITVANPNKLDTIVHEMIHATTIDDGNSQQEEATAKFIGARVANRLSPGSAPASDFNTVLQNTIPLYQGLRRSNNIDQSLANLGISV